MTVEPAPSRRILIVLTGIINRQPVTFTELVKTLPISRSGVWRALETLHDMNWIIKRNGDGAYRLTEETSSMLRSLDAPRVDIDVVSGLIKNLKAAGFDADFGQFTSPGRFRILESSRTSALHDRPLSMVTDDLCLAAQALLPMGELIQHLREFQRFADPADQAAIRKGEHAQVATLARQERITWSQDDHAFSVGVILSDGLVGAIRVHSGKNTGESFDALAQSVPKTSNLRLMCQWIDGEL